MAGTAVVHPHHIHVPSVATLQFGWPRRVAAFLMVAVGGAFVAITLTSNLFSVGPSFDRMTSGFRPIMTQQALQTDRQDIAALAAASTEIQTKLLPTLAQQLNVTPAQLQTLMAAQYPHVATGLSQVTPITQNFTGLVNTLNTARPLFNSADATPTKSIPAATVPWALLGVGLAAIGLGVFVWFGPPRRTPKGSAIIATVVGAVLIALPLSLNMVTKASNADSLNKLLKPVYNSQLISQANGALNTLGAMGTEMQQQMLPALAAQLHLTPAQLNAMLGHNFPATAAALTGLPTSMARFHDLVTRFDKHLSDYKTLKPVSFEPIVWSMVIGGIALFALGGAGVVITRKSGSVA